MQADKDTKNVLNGIYVSALQIGCEKNTRLATIAGGKSPELDEIQYFVCVRRVHTL